MKLSTAINHENRLLGKLKDAHRTALIFKKDHMAYIADKKKHIYKDPAWLKTPRHVRDYILGYADCLWNDIQNNHIAWVLPYKGINYLRWDDLPAKGKESYTKNESRGKHVHKSDMKSNW